MIVLDKIIEILLGKALDRLEADRAPRKKLAKGFVDLFDALIDCHKSYSELAHAGQSKIAFHERHDVWRTKVLRLTKSIDRLKTILQIQDPRLFNEVMLFHTSELTGLPVPEGMTYDYFKLLTTISKEFHANDQAQFDTMMASLRNFITEKLGLTSEDLIDAKSWI